MTKSRLIPVILGVALLALLCAKDGRCDSPSVLSWLNAVPGQWGPSDDFKDEKEEDSGKKVGEISVGAGLRMTIFARHLHTTHAVGRPHNWSLFTQHSQVDDDSEWYAVHRIGALRFCGEYPLSKELTLRGALLLGANGANIEYTMGTGNNLFSPTRDMSSSVDTLTGWYPEDMFYGLEVEGTFSLGEIALGARLRSWVGSMPVESTVFIFVLVDGWYTFWSNELEVFAEYKTDYGTPWVGIGLSLYEGWAHYEEQSNFQPEEYFLHYRETQWFDVVLGYRIDLKSGHFMGVSMALVGQWSFSLEAGYNFM